MSNPNKSNPVEINVGKSASAICKQITELQKGNVSQEELLLHSKKLFEFVSGGKKEITEIKNGIETITDPQERSKNIAARLRVVETALTYNQSNPQFKFPQTRLNNLREALTDLKKKAAEELKNQAIDTANKQRIATETQEAVKAAISEAVPKEEAKTEASAPAKVATNSPIPSDAQQTTAPAASEQLQKESEALLQDLIQNLDRNSPNSTASGDDLENIVGIAEKLSPDQQFQTETQEKETQAQKFIESIPSFETEGDQSALEFFMANLAEIDNLTDLDFSKLPHDKWGLLINLILTMPRIAKDKPKKDNLNPWEVQKDLCVSLYWDKRTHFYEKKLLLPILDALCAEESTNESTSEEATSASPSTTQEFSQFTPPPLPQTTTHPSKTHEVQADDIMEETSIPIAQVPAQQSAPTTDQNTTTQDLPVAKGKIQIDDSPTPSTTQELPVMRTKIVENDISQYSQAEKNQKLGELLHLISTLLKNTQFDSAQSAFTQSEENYDKAVALLNDLDLDKESPLYIGALNDLNTKIDAFAEKLSANQFDDSNYPQFYFLLELRDKLAGLDLSPLHKAQADFIKNKIALYELEKGKFFCAAKPQILNKTYFEKLLNGTLLKPNVSEGELNFPLRADLFSRLLLILKNNNQTSKEELLANDFTYWFEDEFIAQCRNAYQQFCENPQNDDPQKIAAMTAFRDLDNIVEVLDMATKLTRLGEDPAKESLKGIIGFLEDAPNKSAYKLNNIEKYKDKLVSLKSDDTSQRNELIDAMLRRLDSLYSRPSAAAILVSIQESTLSEEVKKSTITRLQNPLEQDFKNDLKTDIYQYLETNIHNQNLNFELLCELFAPIADSNDQKDTLIHEFLATSQSLKVMNGLDLQNPPTSNKPPINLSLLTNGLTQALKHKNSNSTSENQDQFTRSIAFAHLKNFLKYLVLIAEKKVLPIGVKINVDEESLAQSEAVKTLQIELNQALVPYKKEQATFPSKSPYLIAFIQFKEAAGLAVDSYESNYAYPYLKAHQAAEAPTSDIEQVATPTEQSTQSPIEPTEVQYDPTNPEVNVGELAEIPKINPEIIMENYMQSPKMLTQQWGLIAATCHIGRQTNKPFIMEDCIAIKENCVSIIDGMGGQGQLGSKAAKILAEKLNDNEDAAKAIGETLIEYKNQNLGSNGAVFSSAKIKNGKLRVDWCGDSSVVVIRKGSRNFPEDSLKYTTIEANLRNHKFQILQSNEHNVLRAALEENLISQNEYENGWEGRKSLFSANFTYTDAKRKVVKGISLISRIKAISSFEIELQQGDIVLVMSDGVSDNLSPKKMLEAVDYKNISAATNEILTQAYNGKKSDNISLAIMSFDSSKNPEALLLSHEEASPQIPQHQSVYEIDTLDEAIEYAESNQLNAEEWFTTPPCEIPAVRASLSQRVADSVKEFGRGVKQYFTRDIPLLFQNLSRKKTKQVSPNPESTPTPQVSAETVATNAQPTLSPTTPTVKKAFSWIKSKAAAVDGFISQIPREISRIREEREKQKQLKDNYAILLKYAKFFGVAEPRPLDFQNNKKPLEQLFQELKRAVDEKKANQQSEKNSQRKAA